MIGKLEAGIAGGIAIAAAGWVALSMMGEQSARQNAMQAEHKATKYEIQATHARLLDEEKSHVEELAKRAAEARKKAETVSAESEEIIRKEIVKRDRLEAFQEENLKKETGGELDLAEAVRARK